MTSLKTHFKVWIRLPVVTFVALALTFIALPLPFLILDIPSFDVGKKVE